MKIEATRSLQPKSLVLQNRRENRLPFSPSSFEIGIPVSNQQSKLDSESLIEALETIAHDNSEIVIGFHKSEKDPTDLILGQKAKELAISIKGKDYVPPSDLNNITKFLSTYFLVKELQTVAKERGHKFGFTTKSVLPEDKELAKKAIELASSIARNPHSINKGDGQEFLETIGMIILLERVANQKLEAGSLSLFNTKQNIEEEDLKIGERAKFLALGLKQNANSLTISRAKEFLKSQNLIKENDDSFPSTIRSRAGREGLLIPSFV